MRHSTKLNLGTGFASQHKSLNSLDDLKFSQQTLSALPTNTSQFVDLDIQEKLSQRLRLVDFDINIDSSQISKNAPAASFDIPDIEPPSVPSNLLLTQDLSAAVTAGIKSPKVVQKNGGYCSLCAACGQGNGHSHSAGLEFEGGVAQFNAGNTKWSQPGGRGTSVDITYSFAPNFQLQGLTNSQSETLFAEALGVWAEVAPLNFNEIEDPGNGQAVDIRVEADFIDGRNGTLAFAFFPRGGDQTYDTGENWSSSLFLETAVHEIGHSLGLGHESGVDALMNPSIQGRFNGAGTAFLLQDDINGIRSLYGNGSGTVRPISSDPTQLNGDDGNNTLIGGAADETLLGFAGNDFLDGKGGDDLIRGSDGNDIVVGSTGDDTLFGGNGNDRAYAGSGNDIVFGSRGNDRLAGGEGNDNVVGGGGRDTLIGVFTSEAKPGAGEIDTLAGEQGPDTFVLGDSQKVYYADDTPLVDYAFIRDFNPNEGDRLQLKGQASDYSLGSSFRGIPDGITITYEGSPTKEIIAVIQGTSNFSLNSNVVNYV